jgi:hypothetical protein
VTLLRKVTGAIGELDETVAQLFGQCARTWMGADQDKKSIRRFGMRRTEIRSLPQGFRADISIVCGIARLTRAVFDLEEHVVQG